MPLPRLSGGGTSGCVLAGRLAEASSSPSDVSILIIEAGPDSAGNQLVTMVGGLFQAMGGDLDWSFETVPQEYLDNRILQLARGKFLGGSSGFNGTLCIRGCKADYDDWGLDGWSGEEMFRYMKKAETFHDNSPWFEAAEGVHGTDGPLHVEPHEVAPISNRIMVSMLDKGLPFVSDMFTTGEAIHACSHVPRTVHDGVRSFSTAFLKGHEGRVDIVTSTLVDKIILEDVEGKVMATGITVIDSAGKEKVFKARKQIVVSAGEHFYTRFRRLAEEYLRRILLTNHSTPVRHRLKGRPLAAQHRLHRRISRRWQELPRPLGKSSSLMFIPDFDTVSRLFSCPTKSLSQN